MRAVFGVLAAAALALTASPTAAQLAPPAEYRNPVHDVDFADPFVLSTPSGWYAYATHRGLANIQIAHSADLVTWRDVGTALPVLPLWATGPHVWAPSVLARDGHHVLYYAVRERSSGAFCISAATSTLPAGPFVDRSDAPLVCQRERGGTIDPSPFVDHDGRAYLLYKSEGVAGREPTRLWSQALAPDGLALEGGPAELLVTALAWESPIVENPAMRRDADGGYHLLYSGGRWSTGDYAVGWARCAGPAGPCERGSATPILQAGGGVQGPGGADFFGGADGSTWLSYHGWIGDQVGYPAGRRALLIQRITFARGRPWLDGPTLGPVRFDRVPGPPPSPAPVPPPPSPSPAAPAAAPAVAAGAPDPPSPLPPPTTTTDRPAAATAVLSAPAAVRRAPTIAAAPRRAGDGVALPRRPLARPAAPGRPLVSVDDRRATPVGAAAAVGAAVVVLVGVAALVRRSRSPLVDAEADLDLHLPPVDLAVLAEVGAQVGDLAPRLPVDLRR